MDEQLCKVRIGGWGEVDRVQVSSAIRHVSFSPSQPSPKVPARGDRSQTARERTCTVRRLYITISSEGGGGKCISKLVCITIDKG